VIGWVNLSVENGRLESDIGFVHAPDGRRAFQRELETELDRMGAFLGLEAGR
jgi:hypothetical protein